MLFFVASQDLNKAATRSDASKAPVGLYLACGSQRIGMEILENRDVRTTPQAFSKCFRHCDPAAYYYYIYIFGGTLQKNITNVTAYHVTLQSECVSGFGNVSEDRFAKILFQFLL